MHTKVEENYIKAIYHLTKESSVAVKTTKLCTALNHKPSTTTEALDRLAKKRLIWYEKYKGAELSPMGQTLALSIVRRHRLWECFLYQHLHFSWDEIHEIAEELEHIHHPLLIERLDEFLGRPAQDPHGEAIPDRTGKLGYVSYIPLVKLDPPCKFKVEAVKRDEKNFLRYLDKLKIAIGQIYSLEEVEPFDQNRVLQYDQQKKVISEETARNLLVSKVK